MSADDLERLAGEIGARDIFVFHLLSEDRMVNLDGWGRGSGWAGNVCLDPETETFLAEALERGISRLGPGSPTRVFGPYWAEEAVAFRSNGHVVALGGDGVSQLADDTIRETARKAVESMKDVRASQRLAAELEIAQAELSVATIRSDSLEQAMEELARAAARALSCEFGAVLLLGDRPILAMADEGWRPAATPDEVVAALIPLTAVAEGGLHLEQDLRESPFAVPPISFDEGLVSRCTVSFEVDGRHGLIVVGHSGSSPRGFTDLCQTVAVTMAASTPLPLSRLLESANLS